MAQNITLNNVATFQNDTTAVNTVNNNNTAIVNAFTDILSRSGVGPNQMTSALDMNNNQIINLPPPQTVSSPARLIDVVSPGLIGVTNAITGTSGHTVPFLDGTNTWSAPQTFNSTGIAQSIATFQTASGTSGTNVNLNQILIGDSINAGVNQVAGLNLLLATGGGTVVGPRVGLTSTIQLNSPTNAGNVKTYLGIQGSAFALSSDGGTSPNSSATSAGEIQGGNLTVLLGASATSLFATIGLEVNSFCLAGSSTWAKALLALAGGGGSDAVAGTVINNMIWMYNHIGAAKYNIGINIDNLGGLGQFPISTTGTLFKTTGGGSVLNGIDFTNTTFSGNSFLSNGFSVSPVGLIVSGGAGIASGILQLTGTTSGNIQLQTNSTSNLLTITQPIQVGVIGTTAGQINIAGLTSGSTQLSCSATGSVLQLASGSTTIDTNGNIITIGATRIGSASAVVAGGDVGRGYFMSTGGLAIYYGSGAPTITAAQGSLYINTTGNSTSTRLFVNTTGSNVWTNFTSAA